MKRTAPSKSQFDHARESAAINAAHALRVLPGCSYEVACDYARTVDAINTAERKAERVRMLACLKVTTIAMATLAAGLILGSMAV